MHHISTYDKARADRLNLLFSPEPPQNLHSPRTCMFQKQSAADMAGPVSSSMGSTSVKNGGATPASEGPRMLDPDASQDKD